MRTLSAMDTLIRTKLCVTRALQESNPVAAVVAYEDSATEARATEFCRSLGKQLGPNRELTRQMWLLGELRVPRLRAIAAGDAAQADLVIISVHHCENVPEEIQGWMELWLGKPGRRPCLILALLDPVSLGVSSSLRAYLDAAARQGKMEFLVQAEEAFEEF